MGQEGGNKVQPQRDLEGRGGGEREGEGNEKEGGDGGK